MVVGAKKTLQSIPSRGKISVMKIQNFTLQKRHSVIKLAYGILLVLISIVMAVVDPIKVVSNWYLDMREGSFLYRMWESPPYELFTEVWVYNYTNVQEFLDGRHDKLRVEEIGPFKYREFRTNENITIDKENGTMTFNPKMVLKFIREESVADLEDISVYVPNIALLALSTLAADNLGYFPNAGAYYSIKAMRSKLFIKLTMKELFWGYKDPLVSIANTLLPGWIDFGKLGLLDRFYSQRTELAELELRDLSKRYSIRKWNKLQGLPEQGFRNISTSSLCNRVTGDYEGLMLSPNFPKGRGIPLFRKQACRTYPFNYEKEEVGEGGYNTYSYTLADTAFSRTSPYACNCTQNCLPEGFVDISRCYYGFPIALSKPHFKDVDPVQQSYFEGMTVNPDQDGSFLQMEPTVGVPLSLKSNIQVNLAVRTSPGNPVTIPLKDKVVPLAWLSLYCKGPPQQVQTLLRLRLVIAPPLVITLEVVIFTIGLVLTAQGAHRAWKPRYQLVENQDKSAPTRKVSMERSRKRSTERKKSMERRKSSVILNVFTDNKLFRTDDELAKEAVSLLAINEDDNDFPDMNVSD